MVKTRCSIETHDDKDEPICIVNPITGDIDSQYIDKLIECDKNRYNDIVSHSLGAFKKFAKLNKLTSATPFCDIVNLFLNNNSDNVSFEYNGFIISNQLYKENVSKFINYVDEMCHITMENCPIRDFFMHPDNKLTFVIPSSTSFDELNKTLYSIYNIPEMWTGLDTIVDINDPVIYKYTYWLIEMKELFVRLLYTWVKSFHDEPCIETRIQLTLKISRIFIRFDKLLLNKYMPGGLGCGRLLFTIIKKLMQWMNMYGLKHAFLLFAHFMPDMVSNNYYPYLKLNSEWNDKYTQFDETDPDFGLLFLKYKKYIV